MDETNPTPEQKPSVPTEITNPVPNDTPAPVTPEQPPSVPPAIPAEAPTEAPASTPLPKLDTSDTPQTEEVPVKESKTKLYLYIGIGSVVALGVIYLAYSFFLSPDTTSDISSDTNTPPQIELNLDNALGNPSESQEEVDAQEEFVQEYSDQFADENPPSIQLDLTEESPDDSSTEKLAR